MIKCLLLRKGDIVHLYQCDILYFVGIDKLGNSINTATGLGLSSLGNSDPNSDPTILSLQWEEWLRRYERFLVAMDIKDDTR